MDALGQRIRAAHARDPARFRVAAILALLLVALVARLVFGDDPWHDGVQERAAAGKVIRSKDYAATWGWLAAAINLVLVGGVLGTMRWWWRSAAEGAIHPSPPRSRAWLAGVLMLVLAAGWLAAPRLHHSLWDDELFMVRWFVHGTWHEAPSGQMKFAKARWSETFFGYRMPTNHVLQTVLSRVSVSVWRSLADEPRNAFPSEVALRIPSFVAALAAVPAMALLVARLGGPGAGLLAALLLVLHPWFLRYTAEARGYGFVLLWVPVYLWLWINAFERGAWRDFAALGVAQLLLLWTWPGLLTLVATANGILTLALGWRSTREASVGLWRLVVVGVLGSAAFLQLMMPMWPQLQNYLVRSHKGFMGADWLRNAGSHLWAGMPWGGADTDIAFPELALRFAAQAEVVTALLATSLLAMVVGAWRLARRGGTTTWLLPLLLLPGPFSWLLASVRNEYLFVWYSLFVLPLGLILLALGLSAGWEQRGALRRVGLVVALTFSLGFAWLTDPARTTLRARSLNPHRESVLATRPSLDPSDLRQQGIITLSLSRLSRDYDPRGIEIDDLRSLQRWMTRARRDGSALFVNLGWLRQADRRSPEVMALLRNPDLFEAQVFPGFQRGYSRFVYRYLGADAPADAWGRRAGSSPTAPAPSGRESGRRAGPAGSRSRPR